MEYWMVEMLTRRNGRFKRIYFGDYGYTSYCPDADQVRRFGFTSKDDAIKLMELYRQGIDENDTVIGVFQEYAGEE